MLFIIFRFTVANDNHSKVIVVVKGDMPAKEKMPTSLYNYIKTNTYLSADDPNLLTKLKKVLSPKSSKSNSTDDSNNEIENMFELKTMNTKFSCTNVSKPDPEKQIDIIMDGNPKVINPNHFLNEQATHLSYSAKFEIDRNKFEMGQLLGSGNFGSVCEGNILDINHPERMIKVAIKTVNDPLDRCQLHALMCEIKVLNKLDNHPYLVNMVGACTSQYRRGQLWLLLEFCPYGDMKSFLLKNQEKFTKCLNHQICIDGLDERLFIKWAYGISKGMEYLSTKKIMHGDLAARNILIGSKEGQENIYVPKISDFGLSRAFYDKSSYQKQERDCIPWKWMDIYFLETGSFTMNSDVWSFGVVLWEMFSMGRIPYSGTNAKNAIDEIKSGYRLPVPDEINEVPLLAKFYKEVTKLCWELDPKDRWSFSKIAGYLVTYLTDKEKEDYQILHNETPNIANEETTTSDLKLKESVFESDMSNNDLITYSTIWKENEYQKFECIQRSHDKKMTEQVLMKEQHAIQTDKTTNQTNYTEVVCDFDKESDNISTEDKEHTNESDSIDHIQPVVARSVNSIRSEQNYITVSEMMSNK